MVKTPEEIKNSNHKMVHDTSKTIGIVIIIFVGLIILSKLGPEGLGLLLFLAPFIYGGYRIHRWLKPKFKRIF